MKRFGISILAAFLFLSSCASLPSEAPQESSSLSTDTEPQTVITDTAGTTPETKDEAVLEIPDGSFSTDAYTVSEINDTYYLNFADGNDPIPGDDSHLSSTDSAVYFDSLAEMKEKITTNNLSASDLAIIKSAFSEDENGIHMFNLNHLYQATYPLGYTSPNIIWEGNVYGGTLIPQGSQLGTWGFWHILPADQYESRYTDQFDQYIQDYQEDENKEIISHETGTFEDLPCEIYELQTSVAQLRVVWFDIPMGEDQEPLHVSLSYTIDYTGSSDNVIVSDTLPYRAVIFGQSNGQYYQIKLYDFTSIPTVEWLSSFGITPYVDNSDHVAS